MRVFKFQTERGTFIEMADIATVNNMTSIQDGSFDDNNTSLYVSNSSSRNNNIYQVNIKYAKNKLDTALENLLTVLSPHLHTSGNKYKMCAVLCIVNNLNALQ